MKESMFFENISPGEDAADPGVGFSVLRDDLLEEFRKSPSSFANDLDISLDLLNILSSELEKYGTDRTNELSDMQIELVIKTLRSVLRRLGMGFELPFRNFTTFRMYWISQGMAGLGGWQARRKLIEVLLNPVRSGLDVLEENRLTKPLTSPISGVITGWSDVDVELRELRRKYEASVTPQDYRALGTNCIGVLEAVGTMVYNPSMDLRDGETDLPYDRVKERLDRYVERELPGGENEEMRKSIKAVIALANRLKHRTLPNAMMAGLAADATILTASMLRRLADPAFSRILDDETPF